MNDYNLTADQTAILADWCIEIGHELRQFAFNMEEPDSWLGSEEYMGIACYYYGGNGSRRTSEPPCDAPEEERALASVEGFIACLENWVAMLSDLPQHPLVVDLAGVVDEIPRTLRRRLGRIDEPSVDDIRKTIRDVGSELGLPLRLATSRVYVRWRHVGEPDTELRDDDSPSTDELEVLRRVIRVCGPDAPPSKVRLTMDERSVKGMRTQRFYAALRALEKADEYRGFSRPRRSTD